MCAAHHTGTVHGLDDGELWYDSHCAPNANTDGRETAALRILEVAHEIDRWNFLHGHRADDEVRAVAARLFFNGTNAAKLDLQRLDWMAANEDNIERVALFNVAADILRAFAESK